jgi:hypothetical protein
LFFCSALQPLSCFMYFVLVRADATEMLFILDFLLRVFALFIVLTSMVGFFSFRIGIASLVMLLIMDVGGLFVPSGAILAFLQGGSYIDLTLRLLFVASLVLRLVT